MLTAYVHPLLQFFQRFLPKIIFFRKFLKKERWQNFAVLHLSPI